ncbi:hypothetical protein NST38_31060 [Paenibacillus sp. FSL H8-0104]|uniref:hypothetical protein n=1 Tax=Paenibacillus sp. FSL H8-0104 TaxID=2954509 RepID=UPI0030FD74F4
MGFFTRSKKDKPNDSEESAVAVASKDDDESGSGSKLFGRGAKNNQRGKGKRFGGKQKDRTLVQRMELVESVASASLEVLHELVGLGNSAVREVDDGFLLVVITNDMLVASGVDPSGEDYGSFAEALSSESIESLTLAADYENDIIGIIPSSDTLASLDEYEFIHDMPLQWAIVPFDLTDESRLILMDSTVHLDRLIEIAKSPSIELRIEGNQVVDNGESEWQDEDDEDQDDRADDNDMDESENDINSYQEDMEYTYDAFSAENNDLFGTQTESYTESSFDENNFENEEFGEYTDDEEDEFDTTPASDPFYSNSEEELDLGGGFSSDPVVNHTDLTAEESKSIITKALEHTFNNSELNLSVDLVKFDDYFSSFTIVKFDENPTDDSELQRTVSNLRRDANAEIRQFHEIEYLNLRNTYITNLRGIHSQLVSTLDHNDENTTYGGRFHEIDTVYDAAMSDMDRLAANEAKTIHATYNEEREAYGENAKREALAVYDTRYRDERNRKIEGVKDALKSEIKSNRDMARGELFSDRRTVAATLYDKATTALLVNLHEQFQEIMEKELHMHDKFRKNIEIYLREQYSNEVLRAKAEAERLKQNEEADHVRREYKQMLTTSEEMLVKAEQQARLAIQQLEEKHKDQLNELKADYERTIDREKQESDSLKALLNQANENTSKIGEQKEREVEHTMKVYKDQIESQKQDLAFARERAGKSQKQLLLVYAAIGGAALAIGILFGFIFGANSTHQQAPAAPAALTQPVSIIHGADVPSVDNGPMNGSVA